MINKTLSFALITLVLCACKKPVKTYEVKAPFKNIVLNSTTKMINPAEAQIVKFDKEFSVEVPQNAFQDADGNLITEPVELSVKKFNNSASIIASGIPMKVTDENGEEQQMESAGMFDIRGKSNGKDVFVADGKTLNIITKSSISGNDYDAYYFEETDISSQKMSILPSSSNQNKKAGRWKKLGGEKENKNFAVGIDSFVLNLDTAKNGILSMLSDVKWQTAYNHKFANPAKIDSLKNEKWRDVNFNEPERVIEFTELNFEKEKNIGITIVKNQLCVYDKKEINFIESGLILDISSTNLNIFNLSIYDFKDNIIVSTGKETLIFSLKGKLIKQLEGSFIPSINEKYSTILLHHLYKKNFYLLKKDGSIVLKGDSLKSIHYEKLIPLNHSRYYGLDRYYPTNFDSFLITNKEGSQTIYSGSGDIIFSDEKLSKGKVIGVSPKQRFVIMVNDNFDFFIADKKKDRVYQHNFDFESFSKKINDNEKITVFIRFIDDDELVFHPRLQSNPESIYRISPVSLWNLETSEKTAYLGEFDDCFIGEKEIICHKYGINNLTKRFDFKGKEISIENSFYGLSKIGDNYLRKLSLVNSRNKIVKDFKAHDEDTKSAQVLNNQIYTSTKQGRIYCWDSVGTLLWSMDNRLNDDRRIKVINKDYLFCRKKSKITMFDQKGNLSIHSKNYFILPVKNNFENAYILPYKEFNSSSASPVRIENQNIAKNIYEVQLSNKDKFFITYVAVDDENKSLIEKYQKALNKIRKNRKTSNEFARELKINRFGLYNYDRFYKNPDAVIFTADFEIPGTWFDVRETEVFQITGLNNRAVIRHNENSFDKFSIVKDFPNQLLVILPDEKIAVFSQEDFNNIDIEKLKKDKKYTFKLKVLDKIESASQLASILNTDGV
ncbi:MAG: hypothetical protein CMP67_10310 [Flavobacteriales bacterium]|nr:hypothetical protein [Flavobacteriales bacterium]|tara:strand:+ start:219 stop:2900 length:2682 start_codon:yes stop_codon:yes gene_type:complete